MLKDSLKTIALSLIILSLMGVVYAWTEPTATPPNNNTATPITVNDSTQVKSGALGIQGTLVGYADGYVVNKMGIGELNVDSDLKLDVAGKVGATEYCDEYGANCKTIASLGAGGGQWLTSGNNIYNTNSGNVGIGTTNLDGAKLRICDGNICIGFKRVYENRGEDIYGAPSGCYGGPPNPNDTCNDSAVGYNCPANLTRTCVDYYSGCSVGTYRKNVSCIAKEFMVGVAE